MKISMCSLGASVQNVYRATRRAWNHEPKIPVFTSLSSQQKRLSLYIYKDAAQWFIPWVLDARATVHRVQGDGAPAAPSRPSVRHVRSVGVGQVVLGGPARAGAVCAARAVGRPAQAHARSRSVGRLCLAGRRGAVYPGAYLHTLYTMLAVATYIS